MMYEVRVRIAPVATAHAIRGHPSRCKNTHGHNFEVWAVVQSDRLNECNLVVDFATVKRIVREQATDLLDHADANEVMKSDNASTEAIATWIWLQSSVAVMAETGYGLAAVEVHETENNVVIFRP